MTSLIFWNPIDGTVAKTSTDAVPRKGDNIFINGVGYSVKFIAWEIDRGKAEVVIQVEKKMFQHRSTKEFVASMDKLTKKLGAA